MTQVIYVVVTDFSDGFQEYSINTLVTPNYVGAYSYVVRESGKVQSDADMIIGFNIQVWEN